VWSRLQRWCLAARRESVETRESCQLAPELEALGQQLARQAEDLAATYPACATPRWAAAGAGTEDHVGLAGREDQMGLAGWETGRAAGPLSRCPQKVWLPALASCLTLAVLAGVWQFCTPDTASNRTARQPRAEAAGGQRAGPHSASGRLDAAHAEPLLTTRGAPAPPAAIASPERVAPPETRFEMPAHLFESLSGPEQEAVLDLLNHVSMPGGTLDL